MKPDRSSAVVALTHDPKIDDPGLIVALRSPAFYIGALGSRRTHAKRLERLAKEGFGENELSRIHGPIGLNIGGVSQAEVAVSIVARDDAGVASRRGIEARMQFGEVPVEQAEGAILVHSLRLGKTALRKGRILSATDLAEIEAAGIHEITVVRLEPGDVREDPAADRIAAAAAGPGITTAPAFTGRANLFAEAKGVLVFDREQLDRLNLIDEAVTLGTLPPYAVVEPRQMVATVKIIPFAVPEEAVARCAAIAAEGGKLLRVAAFRPLAIGMIQTRLAGPQRNRSSTRRTRSQLGGSIRSAASSHSNAAVRTKRASLPSRSKPRLKISTCC